MRCAVKLTVFSMFVAMVCGAFGSVPALAAERVLHIYNWSDYIDPTILEAFTKETKIKVVYDVYDQNEALETKLLAGGTGYDIVVPTASFLKRQIEVGLFQKLDKSKLPNLKNGWDFINEKLATYDPGNQYAVNYVWGTTGIGINVKAVKEALGENAPVDSLALVFNKDNMQKLAKCGVYFLDTPEEIVPAVLTYKGINPGSQKTEDYKVAEAALKEVRPYIKKFHSSEYINALANGDICVVLGWSGDILQARSRAIEAKNGVEIAYHVPKEGALMWFDSMAIPADAKNVAEAHEFINFINRPEMMALASNFIKYPNGNKASQAFIDKDVLNDKAIYPDQAVLDRLYTNLPADPAAQRVVTRIWTSIKTKR